MDFFYVCTMMITFSILCHLSFDNEHKLNCHKWHIDSIVEIDLISPLLLLCSVTISRKGKTFRNNKLTTLNAEQKTSFESTFEERRLNGLFSQCS